MKYTVATIAALASVALAQPAITNTAFDLQEGKPYTITYSGCDSGCTIILQNGESDDLKDYDTLTATAEGQSFTFTPSDLPSDTYNFKIVDNESGELNYSEQFDYEGTGAATTSAASSSAASTSAESTSAESSTAVSTTESSEVATTLTSVKTSSVTKTTEAIIPTPNASKNSTTAATPVPSKTKSTESETETETETEETSTEGSEASATASASATTVPDSGAARVTSSLALIAGAVVAMLYL